MVFAYNEIADRFLEKESKLARNSKNKNIPDLRFANIWLITDGGSDINQDSVMSAKKRIPEDVTIKLNVSTIESTPNKDLTKMATFTNYLDTSTINDGFGHLFDSEGVVFSPQVLSEIFYLESKFSNVTFPLMNIISKNDFFTNDMFSKIKLRDGKHEKTDYDRMLDSLISFFVKGENIKVLKRDHIYDLLLITLLNGLKDKELDVINYKKILDIKKNTLER